MALYSGKIGFAETAERIVESEGEPIHSGIFEDTIVERHYRGEIMKETVNWRSSSVPNDDLVPSHRISIIADNFAIKNSATIKYLIWNMTYWKITSIEIQRPRLILSLGGVYNGPKAPTP